MLQSIGSQRVGHEWATDLIWSDLRLHTKFLLRTNAHRKWHPVQIITTLNFICTIYLNITRNSYYFKDLCHFNEIILMRVKWRNLKCYVYLKKHALLLWDCVCILSCLTLCSPIDCSLPRLLCPWSFPGKNTGAGRHFLLQGVFLTQRSNLCLPILLHWRVDSLPLHHLGSSCYFEKFTE